MTAEAVELHRLLFPDADPWAGAVVGVVSERGDEAEAIRAAAEEDGDEGFAAVAVAGEESLGRHGNQQR